MKPPKLVCANLDFSNVTPTLRLTLIRVSAPRAPSVAVELDGGRIQFGSSLVVGSPPQAQDQIQTSAPYLEQHSSLLYKR